MYRLTQKTNDILDLIGYKGDRVFNSTSSLGWTIGKSRKFVAFGLTKDEGIEQGFLTIHPLYELCKHNAIIPVYWIKTYLTEEQFKDWADKSQGSTMTNLGVYSRDVEKYLKLSGL